MRHLLIALATSTLATTSVQALAEDPPNILFIVLDDIGIDATSIEPFGWNQMPLAPEMPVLEAIARDGLSFTNFWATPECSPSRACFLTGRWGHRTGVTTAIVDPMLAAVHLHPSEVTLPELLRDEGYTVAMIGKYHLAGDPPYTPPGYGYEAPASTAKLDYYEGYWSLPPSIDRTVGGQVSGDDTPCGIPMSLPNQLGAACFPTGSCANGDMIWGDCEENISPLTALARGGLPLLDAEGNLATSCDDCSVIDLCNGGSYEEMYLNAYYAWQNIVTNSDGEYTPDYPDVDPEREYLTEFISRRSAEMITTFEAANDSPWMCMVTHSSAHTPLQTPPPALTGANPTHLNCDLPTTDPNVSYREVYTLMIESVDRSLGNMLQALDLGEFTDNGFELGDLAAQNTLLVVIGDNGSFGYTVFPPFNNTEAKQTVYQTGVWVPCIAAGAGVNAKPGAFAEVDHDVNVVDLFGLFCDVAGVDYHARVEEKYPGRVLDTRPMLPYLEDPGHEAIREFDFAVYQGGMYGAVPGTPQYQEGGIAGACANGNLLLDQLISTACLCEANGGNWLPAFSCGESGNEPLYSYCDLYEKYLDDPCSQYLLDANGQRYAFEYPMPETCPSFDCDDGATPICMQPPSRGQWAVRQGRWKLIALQYPDCLPEDAQCQLEFYLLGETNAPNMPGIESSANTIQFDVDDLSKIQQAKFNELKAYMYTVLSTNWYCPGDGNHDLKVDGADLAAALADWGYPSFWDVDRNGTVGGSDIGLILANWNPDCIGQVSPADADLPYNNPAYIPSCIRP